MQLCCQTQFFLKRVIFLEKKNKNKDFYNQKRTISSLFSAFLSLSWTIFSKNIEDEKIFYNALPFCEVQEDKFTKYLKSPQLFLQSAAMQIENLRTTPNVHQKNLHFNVFLPAARPSATSAAGQQVVFFLLLLLQLSNFGI